VYDIEIPESSIVIDVGFNVGFASLFFAAKKNVSKIYSFEPVRPTFEQGLNNLCLNTRLSTKIEPFNFGLSDCDALAIVDYSYQCKGQVSTNFRTPRYAALHYYEETVSLKDANFLFE